MSPEIHSYTCVVIAVLISRLAKGGFSGVGALAISGMPMAIDPMQGAAILLSIRRRA